MQKKNNEVSLSMVIYCVILIMMQLNKFPENFSYNIVYNVKSINRSINIDLLTR